MANKITITDNWDGGAVSGQEWNTGSQGRDSAEPVPPTNIEAFGNNDAGANGFGDNGFGDNNGVLEGDIGAQSSGNDTCHNCGQAGVCQ